MDEENHIGKRLEIVANEFFGGNKSELARYLGKDPNSFYKYFKGHRTPGLDIIAQLGVLGVDLHWFSTGQKNRDSEIEILEKRGLDSLTKRIKWVRLHYRKTISEMAQICAVSSETQISIEKSDKEPWKKYLDRILKNFTDVREEWLLKGEEPKLHSLINLNQVNDDPGVNYFDGFEKENLSPEEEELLGEVEQFSDFLKRKDLKPRLKRILLERLIDSIDQALDQPQRKE